MIQKRAALIGLGMVADTHARALAEASNAALHGVFARDPDKAAAFAARHGDPVAYPSLEALMADEKVDFVIP